MRLDRLGIPIYSEQDIIDLLYAGNSKCLSDILVDISDDEFNKFNHYSQANGLDKINRYQDTGLTQKEFDSTLQHNWLMPEEYKNLDIEQWIKENCPPTNTEQTRVKEELDAFRDHNMLNLLRWLKYFVDTCRANNIVWGVGRGSSVASYVLFILGVHKINSLKYNLDWREFLR